MSDMKRIGRALCVVLLCAGGGSFALAADIHPQGVGPGEPDVLGGYASTHVIIRVQPDVQPVVLADGRLTLRAAPDALPPAGPGTKQAAPAQGHAGDLLAVALQRWGVVAIKPLFENGFADAALAQQLGLDRTYRVEVPQGSDVAAIAADLRTFAALIEHAELDGIGGVAVTIPNDPMFDLLWGMLNTGQVIQGVAGVPGADINITLGWDLTTGDPDLVLAVLDAGMDPHVELVNRMIPGRNVAANPDNDDTSDVCLSHGTHVAGTAAADANNDVGVAGVNWSCRIMPVRVLNGCTGSESFVAEGLIWATDNGADVINMSLQYFTGTSTLHNAVLYAHGHGVVMIAAAGNQNSSQVAFPARWPQTIAVGAINNLGQRWDVVFNLGSNTGPNLDIMGPGVDVWSLKDTQSYQWFDGTSMATPHVSGTVSLLKSLDPLLSPDQLRQIIQQTAVDMNAAGFDNETGFGRLDAYAALLEVAGNPIPGDLDGDGSVGILDLLILLTNWGPCPDPPDPCPADLTGDGAVGIFDLLTLLANWGP